MWASALNFNKEGHHQINSNKDEIFTSHRRENTKRDRAKIEVVGTNVGVQNVEEQIDTKRPRWYGHFKRIREGRRKAKRGKDPKADLRQGGRTRSSQ